MTREKVSATFTSSNGERAQPSVSPCPWSTADDDEECSILGLYRKWNRNKPDSIVIHGAMARKPCHS